MKILIFVFFTIISIYPQSLSFLDKPQIDPVYRIILNGTNEYAYRTSGVNVDIDSSDCTILVWFKTDTVEAFQKIIHLRNSTSAHELRIYLENSRVTAAVSDGTLNSLNVSTKTPSEGVWILGALVVDQTNDSVRVHYVESSIMYSNFIPKSMNGFDAFNHLYVGRNAQDDVRYFSGELGEIAVIKGRALSRGEIIQQYVRGYGCRNFETYDGTTILASYKWSGDTDGEFLSDASDNDNDLTASNVTQADNQIIINNCYGGISFYITTENGERWTSSNGKFITTGN